VGLIPARAFQEKLAALRAADALGRETAQRDSSVQVAEAVGREMAKEAFAGVVKPIAAAGKAVTGLLGKLVGKKAPAAVGKAIPAASHAGGEVVGRVARRSTPLTSNQVGGAVVQRAPLQPGKLRPASGEPLAYGSPGGGTVTQKQFQTARAGNVHATQPVAAQSPFARATDAPTAGAATGSSMGGKSPGKVRPAAEAAPAPVQAGGTAPPAEAAAGAAAEGGKSRGIMAAAWKHRAPLALGAAGLGAYGLMKAAPAAMRMVEGSKAHPMAYGGGWSPTEYGYGSTPWSGGQQGMGRY
jgi:hypothetical protein